MTRTKTVTVNLEDRTYDILTGEALLTKAGELVQPFLPTMRTVIVTDETVFELHGQTLTDSLDKAKITYSLVILPPGEAQKSFNTLETVLGAFFEAGLTRKDVVIAFGGGVIGDLTGFAASVFKRGCDFIQIPTTLLAQVDSSVGGKTAINNSYGKNLVGAFHQPKLVLADIDVLKTLDLRDLKSGYAEVVKYGLLGDRDFFNWLEVNGQKVLDLDPHATAQAIATSCQTKARIVSEDEFESGKRALLNLGHTFGHALELEAGYDGDLRHGEAVSIGMTMAFEFSQTLGLCPAQDVTRMAAHMSTLAMLQAQDTAHLFKDPRALLAHMNQDKKNEGQNLTLILAREIGDSFIEKHANREAVGRYLDDLSKRLTHVG
ncbi:MAG: 3-dehydroquinate synthase [Maricaulaceae bacterium]